MTRSLGDFYPHRHGLSYEPEMRAVPLTDFAKRYGKSPRLLLASDGVWDIFDFDEVCEHLVPPPDASDTVSLEERASRFFEATRSRGDDFFGEARACIPARTPVSPLSPRCACILSPRCMHPLAALPLVCLLPPHIIPARCPRHPTVASAGG